MASHIRTRSRCFSGSHSLPSTLGARRIFGRPRASSPACSERWEMVTARRHSPSRENTFTFGLPPLVSSPREQRRLRRATRHSSAEARPLQTLFQSFLPPKTTVGIVPFSRWALSSASFVSREATRAFRPFTARPSFSRTSEGAPLFAALASFFTVWPSLFLARPSLVCVSSMSLSSTSRWESRTAWDLRPKSSWPSSFTVSREAPSTSRVKAHRSQAQKRRISVARGVSSPRDQRGERKAGNVSGKNSPVIVMTSFLSFRFDTAHQLLKSLAHFPASPGPVQSRGKRRDDGQQVLHQLRVGILRLLTGRDLDLNSTPPQVTFQGRIPKPRQPVRMLDQQPAKIRPAQPHAASGPAPSGSGSVPTPRRCIRPRSRNRVPRHIPSAAPADAPGSLHRLAFSSTPVHTGQRVSGPSPPDRRTGCAGYLRACTAGAPSATGPV